MAGAPLVTVMAKVPRPGAVKTRLVPALGAAAAAALARAMAEDVFTLVAASGLPWRVGWAGLADDPWTATLPGTAPPVPQVEGDLGEKLAAALLGGGIAVGTDAPTLPLDRLHAAAASPADLTLVPAEDGGYALVRVSAEAVRRGVFFGVPWSRHYTLARQVDRARALGLTVALLEPWRDVDELPDLLHLRASLLDLPPSSAPHTRRWFESPHAAALR